MNIAFLSQHGDAGGVEELCRRRSDWNLIRLTESSNIQQALAGSCPDLLVTDIARKDSRKSTTLSEVREQFPYLPLVVIAGEGTSAEVTALSIGAASYVPRSRVSRDLEKTIERIINVTGRTHRAQLCEFVERCEQEFNLPSDTTAVAALIGHFCETAERIGLCSRHELHRLAVSLDEAISNAIVHGNLEVSSDLRELDEGQYLAAIHDRLAQDAFGKRTVNVQAVFERDHARFTIRDEGPGFDIDSVPDPRAPEELTKPHGRGVMLMRLFMDEVRYNARGNEVTLIKRLH